MDINNVKFSAGANKYLKEQQELCTGPEKEQDKTKLRSLYACSAALDNDQFVVSEAEAVVIYAYIQKALEEKQQTELSPKFLLEVEKSIIKDIETVKSTAQLVESNFIVSKDPQITRFLLGRRSIQDKLSILKNKYNIDINLVILEEKTTDSTAWEFFSSFIYKRACFIDISGVIYPSDDFKRNQKIDIYILQDTKAVEALDELLKNMIENLK